MKKVVLELTARQLNTLVYSFTYINYVYPKTREQKVMKSILEKLILKIKKKHLEVESSINTLFSKPKKCKFTFEYYEGDCLEKYLLIVESKQPLNDYDSNAILFIKNKLNQQLA
jgi:hypothetical protein